MGRRRELSRVVFETDGDARQNRTKETYERLFMAEARKSSRQATKRQEKGQQQQQKQQ
jgi:hypothetical protein